MPNPTQTYHFDLFENRLYYAQKENAKLVKECYEKDKIIIELREKIKMFNALSRQKKK